MKLHKMGLGSFFSANPDLVDILGDMELDIENLYLSVFLDSKFLDFQIPRFPKSGLGRAGPGLSHLDQRMLNFYNISKD